MSVAWPALAMLVTVYQSREAAGLKLCFKVGPFVVMFQFLLPLAQGKDGYNQSTWNAKPAPVGDGEQASQGGCLYGLAVDGASSVHGVFLRSGVLSQRGVQAVVHGQSVCCSTHRCKSVTNVSTGMPAPKNPSAVPSHISLISKISPVLLAVMRNRFASGFSTRSKRAGRWPSS